MADNTINSTLPDSIMAKKITADDMATDAVPENALEQFHESIKKDREQSIQARELNKSWSKDEWKAETRRISGLIASRPKNLTLEILRSLKADGHLVPNYLLDQYDSDGLITSRPNDLIAASILMYVCYPYGRPRKPRTPLPNAPVRKAITPPLETVQPLSSADPRDVQVSTHTPLSEALVRKSNTPPLETVQPISSADSSGVKVLAPTPLHTGLPLKTTPPSSVTSTSGVQDREQSPRPNSNPVLTKLTDQTSGEGPIKNGDTPVSNDILPSTLMSPPTDVQISPEYEKEAGRVLTEAEKEAGRLLIEYEREAPLALNIESTKDRTEEQWVRTPF